MVTIHSGGIASVRGEGALEPALAAVLGEQLPAGSSIWTSLMEGEARLAVCDGLPGQSRMIEFLDVDAQVWRGDVS